MLQGLSATIDPAVELPQVAGCFGPLGKVPLINQLIATPIIDAVILGYGALHSPIVAGLVQNDGVMFPAKPNGGRSELLFSEYCRNIRRDPQGRKLCEACDAAGVKLVLGMELTDEEKRLITQPESPTGKATRYYCHAGLLEIIIPTRLTLVRPEGRWEQAIGAFWGGQVPVRTVGDMLEVFETLGRSTSRTSSEWRHDYEGLLERMGPSDTIVHIEQTLVEMSEAISQSLTRAYRLMQHEKAGNRARQFSERFRLVLDKVSEKGKVENALERLKGLVSEELSSLVKEYGLKCSCIYRLQSARENEPRMVASPFATFPSPAHREVKASATVVRFPSPNEEVLRPTALVGQEIQKDELICNITRAWGCDPSTVAMVVMPFASSRTGQYLWVSIEEGKKRWLVAGNGVEPEFSEIFEHTAIRMASCLDALDLLREIEKAKTDLQAKKAELEERQSQTWTFIIRMAHLVSRPLLQLNLASEALVGNPKDPSKRDSFGSTLFELRRASKNFHAFRRLMSIDGGDRNENKKPSLCNVADLVQDVIKRITPLAKLGRRAIDVNVMRTASGEALTITTLRDSASEVMENLIHNAVKYSMGGRQVSVDIQEQNDGVEVLIKNYGCGIGPEEKEKIFDLDYRSEMTATCQVEGAGMGLWVARKLVEIMQGEVTLLSCTPYDVLESKNDKENPINRFEVVFRLWLPKNYHEGERP